MCMVLHLAALHTRPGKWTPLAMVAFHIRTSGMGGFEALDVCTWVMLHKEYYTWSHDPFKMDKLSGPSYDNPNLPYI